MTAAEKVRAALVTIALLAIGLWIGGMVSLGAIAAPAVFGIVPAPTNADAMTVVFRRFDKLALACLVVALLVEVALAVLARRMPSRLDLARGLFAAAATAAVLYVGSVVSPQIESLHREGARRGVGEAGLELDRIHRVAQRMGQVELALAVAMMALHVVSLARRRDPKRDASDDRR